MEEGLKKLQRVLLLNISAIWEPLFRIAALVPSPEIILSATPVRLRSVIGVRGKGITLAPTLRIRLASHESVSMFKIKTPKISK